MENLVYDLEFVYTFAREIHHDGFPWSDFLSLLNIVIYMSYTKYNHIFMFLS